MSYYDGTEDWPDEDGIEDCDHEDFDVDILTGRAECDRCTHSWTMTAAEFAAWEVSWHHAQEAWERHVRSQCRAAAIEPFLRPFRLAWRWLRARWTPARIAVFGYRDDDEIPF